MGDGQSRMPASRLASAFWFQYNVILLFGAVCYSAALASLTPMALGAIGEIVWLLLAVSIPGLSAFIEGHRASAGRDSGADSSLAEVDPVYAARVHAIARIHAQIWRTKLDMTGVTSAELRTTRAQLEAVERSFIRLAGAHHRLTRFLASLRISDLENDVARINQALSSEKDLAVRMALRQSLTLLQRRVQQREHTVSTQRAVELQMVAIEQSFLYLESQVLGLGSARELKAEVDAFMVQVGSVDALEAEAGNALTPVGATSLTTRPVPITFGS